jgi:hypothetical protein
MDFRRWTNLLHEQFVVHQTIEIAIWKNPLSSFIAPNNQK